MRFAEEYSWAEQAPAPVLPYSFKAVAVFRPNSLTLWYFQDKKMAFHIVERREELGRGHSGWFTRQPYGRRPPGKKGLVQR
jgi:hypothetical protein